MKMPPTHQAAVVQVASVRLFGSYFSPAHRPLTRSEHRRSLFPVAAQGNIKPRAPDVRSRVTPERAARKLPESNSRLITPPRTATVSYKDQFDRVRRYLARIENQSRDRTEYEDDFWSFFQNCWHLAHWIENDPTLTASTKGNVWNDAKNSDTIITCRSPDFICRIREEKQSLGPS